MATWRHMVAQSDKMWPKVATRWHRDVTEWLRMIQSGTRWPGGTRRPQGGHRVVTE